MKYLIKAKKEPSIWANDNTGEHSIVIDKKSLKSAYNDAIEEFRERGLCGMDYSTLKVIPLPCEIRHTKTKAVFIAFSSIQEAYDFIDNAPETLNIYEIEVHDANGNYG